MGDFNLALVIVAVVVSVLVLLFNVYLLVNYQHPDDKNQAYFPKLVVVFGLSIAVISILMLPADVANRQACRHAIYNGACNLTLPMKTLWLVVYITDAVLVFFFIPFAMFFYEGDMDKSVLSWLGSIASFFSSGWFRYSNVGAFFWQERGEKAVERDTVGCSFRCCLCACDWDTLRLSSLTPLLVIEIRADLVVCTWKSCDEFIYVYFENTRFLGGFWSCL